MDISELENKLGENYHGITDPSIIDDLRDYIRDSNGSYKDIFFLKRLTKVARHAMNGNGVPPVKLQDDELQFLYDSCQLLVDQIAEPDKSAMARMASHVYGDKAEIAGLMSERTNGEESKVWIIKKFQDRLDGYELSRECHPDHAAYQLSFLADTAEELGNIAVGDEEIAGWTRVTFNGRIMGAEYFETKNPEHSGHNYYLAANTAIRLAAILPSEAANWKEQGFDMAGKALELIGNKQIIVRKLYAMRGSEAMALSELKDESEKELWLKRGTENKLESAKRRTDDDLSCGHEYGMAATLSYQLAHKSGNKRKWLPIAVEANGHCARLCFKDDNNYSVMALFNMGRASHELHEITGEIDHLKKAIEGYSTFINSFDGSVPHHKLGVYRMAEKMVNELKQSKKKPKIRKKSKPYKRKKYRPGKDDY